MIIRSLLKAVRSKPAFSRLIAVQLWPLKTHQMISKDSHTYYEISITKGFGKVLLGKKLVHWDYYGCRMVTPVMVLWFLWLDMCSLWWKMVGLKIKHDTYWNKQRLADIFYLRWYLKESQCSSYSVILY